jgi:nitrate reductase gamma subunit
MSNSFLFNGDVVLHLLAVVFGIVACFLAGIGMVLLMTRLVERDCRNDVWFDEDGRRRDDA